MTEDNQLMRSLFKNEQREHVNVKFLRGDSEDISPLEFEEAAASAFLQVDSGQICLSDVFTEDFTSTPFRDFVKAL
jgi:hypothetical protein